jgi:hypothetical protein
VRFEVFKEMKRRGEDGGSVVLQNGVMLPHHYTGSQPIDSGTGILLKGKDNVVPVLNEAPCHVDYEEMVYLHIFLTSALDGGKWSASRRGHFTHSKVKVNLSL